MTLAKSRIRDVLVALRKAYPTAIAIWLMEEPGEIVCDVLLPSVPRVETAYSPDGSQTLKNALPKSDPRAAVLYAGSGPISNCPCQPTWKHPRT